MNGRPSSDSARTLRWTLEVSPSAGLVHRFGAVVAAATASVAEQLYGKTPASRVDVIISELVSNVLESLPGSAGSLAVTIVVEDTRLRVRVSNTVSPEAAQAVKRHVARIQRASDSASLLARTMGERRLKGEQGGLGLIRLASEAKASLSVAHDRKNSMLHVSATVQLEDRS
jgi:hypothetical protein